MSKSPVRKFVRTYVLERDDWTCQYCGYWMSESEATIDHIQAASFGGEHFGQNLRACCQDCNSIKGQNSEQYLRLRLAFDSTPYAGIITMEQYHQLRGKGVGLSDMEPYVFFFERPKTELQSVAIAEKA